MDTRHYHAERFLYHKFRVVLWNAGAFLQVVFQFQLAPFLIQLLLGQALPFVFLARLDALGGVGDVRLDRLGEMEFWIVVRP